MTAARVPGGRRTLLGSCQEGDARVRCWGAGGGLGRRQIPSHSNGHGRGDPNLWGAGQPNPRVNEGRSQAYWGRVV